MATVPTRIDQALHDAARTAGEPHGRTAAEQLDHWARVGRELDAADTVDRDAVARVLDGEVVYDDLPELEQAIVRATWDRRINDRADAMDLEAELRSAGRPWAEANNDGTVRMRGAGPGT